VQIGSTTKNMNTATTHHSKSQHTTSTSASASTSTSTSNSADPTTACTSGHMKCAGTSSYQTCTLAANGQPYWGPTQNCASSLKCYPNGDTIFCNY
jgi:hypothetical protein